MNSLKVGLYEVLTAFALFGLVYLYLGTLHDALIINPSFVEGGLIVLFVVTAVATEAMVASSFRPTRAHLLGFNILIAAVITQQGWGHVEILKGLLGVALMTAVLRMLIATIAMRKSKIAVRRFTSGLVGLVVLSATAWMGFLQVEDAYYSYYLFPKFKEGYIAPTRWQDFVFISVFWVVAILLFYVSYRLLKYAFKHGSRPTGPAPTPSLSHT
jgi:hypothetical protein